MRPSGLAAAAIAAVAAGCGERVDSGGARPVSRPVGYETQQDALVLCGPKGNELKAYLMRIAPAKRELRRVQGPGADGLASGVGAGGRSTYAYVGPSDFLGGDVYVVRKGVGSGLGSGTSVAVGPKGEVAFVREEGSDQLRSVVYIARAGEPPKRLKGFRQVAGIEWTPRDGLVAYVAGRRGELMRVRNLLDRPRAERWPIGASVAVVSDPRSARLAVGLPGSGGRRVDTVVLRRNGARRILAQGGFPVAWSPDGRLVVVSRANDVSAYRADTGTRAWSRSLSCGRVFRMSWPSAT